MIEKFSQHVQFSLRVFYGQVEEGGSYRIDLTKDLPGKTLTAILGTHLQDDHITFTGIITQVSMLHSNGVNGDIIISGYSPTILLESGQHRHSFYNKTLDMIAKEVVANLSGKLEVDIQPRYTQKIPYSAQHRESSFTYLCRMASWFGEWLYYDGRKLCLGWPARQHRQTLYYGKHLERLQMDMQVLPVDTIYTGYMSSQDKVLNMYPHHRTDGLSFYGDLAVEKASQMYPKPVKTYPVQWTDEMIWLL